MPITSKTIPNLVGIQMYYIPPEIVDPEATPIYQNWDANIIIDQEDNRIQYDSSTNPSNVLIYSWNRDYINGYDTEEEILKRKYFWIQNEDSSPITVKHVCPYGTVYYRNSDNGSWKSWAADTEITLNVGSKIDIRRSSTQRFAITENSNFQPTFLGSGQYSIGGNIMSLFYGNNFINQTSIPAAYAFSYVFKDQTNLIDASKLIMQATGLTSHCYYGMFKGTSLTSFSVKLPATTLADLCYCDMFGGCASLSSFTTELPARTMVLSCYNSMFSGCTSLTSFSVELPATTLAEGCYNNMFGGSGLVTAPELPAMNLEFGCYQSMFDNCRSLVNAPSVLPATTLATQCYYRMFTSCILMTTAPILPATTLVTGCYDMMFYNCQSLNYIKAMFTTAPGTSYTQSWVYGVSSTGTFVKNTRATWNNQGSGGHGVPVGWTIQYASS